MPSNRPKKLLLLRKKLRNPQQTGRNKQRKPRKRQPMTWPKLKLMPKLTKKEC